MNAYLPSPRSSTRGTARTLSSTLKPLTLHQVFNSWDGPNAVKYREINKITGLLGNSAYTPKSCLPLNSIFFVPSLGSRVYGLWFRPIPFIPLKHSSLGSRVWANTVLSLESIIRSSTSHHAVSPVDQPHDHPVQKEYS
jgi:hypothetical protein